MFFKRTSITVRRAYCQASRCFSMYQVRLPARFPLVCVSVGSAFTFSTPSIRYILPCMCNATVAVPDEQLLVGPPCITYSLFGQPPFLSFTAVSCALLSAFHASGIQTSACLMLQLLCPTSSALVTVDWAAWQPQIYSPSCPISRTCN